MIVGFTVLVGNGVSVNVGEGKTLVSVAKTAAVTVVCATHPAPTQANTSPQNTNNPVIPRLCEESLGR